MSGGKLTSAADSVTGTILMQYDTSDRIVRIDYPDGRWLAVTCDLAGRRTRRTGNDGYILDYEYDARGRLSRLLDGSGLVIARYQYDAVGEVLSIVHHGPIGEVQSRFDYVYDSLGRPTSVTTLSGWHPDVPEVNASLAVAKAGALAIARG